MKISEVGRGERTREIHPWQTRVSQPSPFLDKLMVPQRSASLRVSKCILDVVDILGQFAGESFPRPLIIRPGRIGGCLIVLENTEKGYDVERRHVIG